MPFFLLFTGACATPSQQAEQPTKLVESAKPAPVTRQTDASAAYHFMLGYQAELAQNSELALKEYQAALKADPTAQSVKARLASLHFSLGDMPNALRYAEEVADGPSQDARIMTHMAGILAGGGQGEKALRVLDRAIEQDPETSDAYFS
ncbi:MAG TPA: tetratricopeptide repeat protein, partial [Nitrospira sp.]|nr:tetratricopeptide repeat protein [Nitrospira sp.]